MDGVNENGTISAEATNSVQLLLKRAFRPELLNRLDEIIIFKPLTKSQIGSIVDLLFKKLSDRLQEKTIKLKITDKAKDLIIEQGYDVSFGARPLKRFISQTIETSIAKEIIAGKIMPNSTMVVDANGDEFTFKNEQK